LKALTEKLGFEPSMMEGLALALSTKPASRGNLDRMVLGAFETQMETRIAELETQIAEATPEREARALALQPVSEAHAQARAAHLQFCKELQEAEAALSEVEGQLVARRRMVGSVAPELSQVYAQHALAKELLDDFLTGPRAAFDELNGGSEQEINAANQHGSADKQRPQEGRASVDGHAREADTSTDVAAPSRPDDDPMMELAAGDVESGVNDAAVEPSEADEPDEQEHAAEPDEQEQADEPDEPCEQADLAAADEAPAAVDEDATIDYNSFGDASAPAAEPNEDHAAFDQPGAEAESGNEDAQVSGGDEPETEVESGNGDGSAIEADDDMAASVAPDEPSSCRTA